MDKKVYFIAYSFDGISFYNAVLAYNVLDAEEKILAHLIQEYGDIEKDVNFSSINPWNIQTIEEYLKQNTELIM